MLLTFSDLISGIALGVSTFSALGVYITPVLQDWRKSKIDNLKNHKRAIEEYVLNPLRVRLIDYMDYYLYKYKRDGIVVYSEKEIKEVTSNQGDFIHIPPLMQIYSRIGDKDNQGRMFNLRLYEDYRNHDPEMYNQIESKRLSVSKIVQSFQERKMAFTRKIYEKLRPEIEKDLPTDKSSQIEDTALLATKVSLLQFLGPGNVDMNNLRNRLSGLDNTISTMDSLRGKEEFLEVEDVLSEYDRDIMNEILDLEHEIYLKATSGKKLGGDCHYLGK